MRPHLLAALLALAVASPALGPREAHADFDASGRGRQKKPPPHPGAGKPTAAGPAKPGPGKPGPAKPPKPDDDGSGEPKGPGADALITRYTSIALSQPTAVADHIRSAVDITAAAPATA